MKLVYSAVIEGIEATGLWGFADTKAGVVHLWISDRATDEEARWLFAHELWHMAEFRGLAGQSEEESEELRAEMAGEIACLVAAWVPQEGQP